MNLMIIAAVIAVASAAKLDRTYLPPASAKTAGGSSESLQTPFAANSLSQEHVGFPKGSFTNDFQGVVVDAAAPGTRASGEGETGLGAPRTAYGSTNSKVGDAAFRGSLAGFRQTPGNSQFIRTDQAGDVQTAGTVETPQGFSQKPDNSQGFGQGSQGFQGSLQGQHNPQSFLQGNSQGQALGSHGVQGSFGSQAAEVNYQRSQALSARDREASILRFDSNVGTDSYSYSFETDNGISAEENGVATNGVQAQGGYSYTGDDGQVYSVTYTADEGGYQPKGDHLPTPPPIPVEILKSLEQNAREEAAGQVDDGSYDAQKYNAEGDYTENVGANGEHNARPPTKFGNRPESDATASGTFINQSNQPFVRPSPNALPGQREEINTSSNVQGSNTFGTSQNAVGFEKIQSNIALPNTQGQNVFGTPPNSNNFVQANETPLSMFHQNNHKEEPQQLGPDLYNNQTVEIDDIRTQGHDVRPTSQPLGKPNGFNQQDTFNNNPSNIHSFGSIVMNGNNFGQQEQSSHSGFGSKNEYLPPVSSFGQNRRPTADQRPGSSMTITSSQDSNKFSQSYSNLHPASEQEVENKSQDSTSTSGFVTSSQSNSQFVNNQNNKFSNGFKPNRFSSTQNVGQTQTDGKSEFGALGSQNIGFAAFQPQKATSQPLTELTTPFETSPNSKHNTAQTSANVAGFATQTSQTDPSSFENEPQSNVISQFPTPTSASSSAFSSSSSTTSAQRPISRPFNSNNDQFSSFPDQRLQSQINNQENGFTQSQSKQEYPQNEATDVQFSSSTQRPIFSQNTQQAQGPDNSYYYNQPSKTFNTVSSQFQSSRFPSSSTSQFNRIPQKSSFSSQSSAQVGVVQQNFPVNSFGSQSSPARGSTRQPIQSGFSSPVPTSATQGSTIPGFNGITQATASSFISGAPTASTQFGSQNSFSGFNQRPTQQLNNHFNNQVSSQSPSNAGQQSFTQQTTDIPQSFSDKNRNKGERYQNQQTGIGQHSSSIEADSTNSDSSNIPSQQYDGEIYDYKKPAQTLPPPNQKETSTSSGQFGNKLSSDRFGHSQDSQGSTTSQIENQTGLERRPQFGSQPSRLQFAQQSQVSSQSKLSSLRPQFGSQSMTPFENPQSTQPSFVQSFDAQKTQQNDQFSVQGSIGEDQKARPQFGHRLLGDNQLSSNQFNQGSSNQLRPQFDQNRPRPSCCKVLPNAPPITQGSTQGASGQFGVQDTGISSQGFKPDQSSTHSFAGKGEVFGGPRKPPSFDDQTGYHY